MSSTATPPAAVSPAERLDVLFGKLAELTGQRNAIDGRIVDIVAEIDHDGISGATGARSIPALVAWKTGVSPRNAETIAAIAHLIEEFPKCAAGMREGRFSLGQVGVIAEKAVDGSDPHYAQMARRPHAQRTRSQTLPRANRRTRPMVVVPTLPTTTSTLEQLRADRRR
jgi:hypothetical protein